MRPLRTLRNCFEVVSLNREQETAGGKDGNLECLVKETDCLLPRDVAGGAVDGSGGSTTAADS